MTMDLYTSVMDDHKKSEMERFNGMIEDIKEMGEEIAEQKYRDMLEKSNVADVIDIGDWVAV